MGKVKRALALSGGGPLVGLHVGALKALMENGIRFDVWSCDCIGSWVACVYNSLPEDTPVETKERNLTDFFSFLFVPDDIYDFFPVPTSVFVVDYPKFIKKYMETFWGVFTHPSQFFNIVKPSWYMGLAEFLSNQNWSLTREEVYAAMGKLNSFNPWIRMTFHAFWKMPISGISMAHVKEMPDIWKNYLDFERLNSLQKEDKYIYINAYNLTDRQIELFSNNKNYQPLCIEALQAGSGILLYVENAEINGKKYCEGANVDTLNFKDLLQNHPDLDEIWILRLADYQYVNPPENLSQAAGLQIMLPFSTIAEDDIKLFKYHLTNEEKLEEIGFSREQAQNLKIIEIKVKKEHLTRKLSYDWTQSNFSEGLQAGYQAALETIEERRGNEN
jgi:predicted acylesterase/phospholipase RssA